MAVSVSRPWRWFAAWLLLGAAPLASPSVARAVVLHAGLNKVPFSGHPWQR